MKNNEREEMWESIIFSQLLINIFIILLSKRKRKKQESSNKQLAHWQLNKEKIEISKREI